MYLVLAARGESAPAMTHGDLFPGGMGYGFTSYMKTAAILHQLRGMVGDEIFFKAMRKYAADWAYKHPYPKDFFHTFSTVAGQDLDWYFRTWFYETWTLDQAVKSVTANDNGTEVVIEDRGYATYPTEVKVTYAGGKTATRTVDVKRWLAGKRTVTLQFEEGVEKVVLDPRRVTLDTKRRNNRWETDG